jgi:hypothetical protein
MHAVDALVKMFLRCAQEERFVLCSLAVVVKMILCNSSNKLYTSHKGVLFFLVIHLFTCAYIVWAISPPFPLPPSPTFFPLPPLVSGRSCSAFTTNFVEEKTQT